MRRSTSPIGPIHQKGRAIQHGTKKPSTRKFEHKLILSCTNYRLYVTVRLKTCPPSMAMAESGQPRRSKPACPCIYRRRGRARIVHTIKTLKRGGCNFVTRYITIIYAKLGVSLGISIRPSEWRLSVVVYRYPLLVTSACKCSHLRRFPATQLKPLLVWPAPVPGAAPWETDAYHLVH
jgi:hypothetical protein